jgi:hypothetical protein
VLRCLQIYLIIKRSHKLSAKAYKATFITKRDMKSFQTYLISAMNSSFLMEGIFTTTAKKMKTALIQKCLATKLLLPYTTEMERRVIKNKSSKGT